MARDVSGKAGSPRRRRRGLAVAALLSTATLASTVLAPAPASATYWSGGMPRAAFNIRPYSYNTSWQPNLNRALTIWNASATPASITKNTASRNYLQAAQYADTWYGLFTSWGPRDSSRYFRIRLNARTIARDAVNFANWVTSCFVHELGHGLSMADNPSTTRASIMKHSRNRNTMISPQPYDIEEVNRIY
jgi:hypothetical protein